MGVCDDLEKENRRKRVIPWKHRCEHRGGKLQPSDSQLAAFLPTLYSGHVWNVWQCLETFWLSKMCEESYWPLVGRGQEVA